MRNFINLSPGHKRNLHPVYNLIYSGLYVSVIFKCIYFKVFVMNIFFYCNQAGDCTLREAIIIGSVIAKNHIPIDNSAAAIMKIAAMDYSGANSIFLRIFFDKKYALPYQVLDECCVHFKR